MVDAQKLVQEIIHERPEFQRPKAEIQIEAPLPTVQGQKASLTQCITNLLTNAVKFVPRGVQPKVQIKSERNDGQVRLWFEDNGIGIEPAAQERIFEMFQRLNQRKEYGGSGIGLTISQKILQDHGGAISLESSQAGKTVFRLSLPLRVTGDHPDFV